MSIGDENKQHKQQKPALGYYIFTRNFFEKLSIFDSSDPLFNIIRKYLGNEGKCNQTKLRL